MKTLAKLFTSGAAILAAIAPATALPGGRRSARIDRLFGPATEVPLRQRTPCSGSGSGTWRLAATDPGPVTARLFDETGRLRYLVRASLFRSGELPPPGTPEQGGFRGILVRLRSDGTKEAVARILGKWIREVDGTGSFGADILVSTGGRDDPWRAIGSLDGELRAPLAISPSGVSTLARLSATWILAE